MRGATTGEPAVVAEAAAVLVLVAVVLVVQVWVQVTVRRSCPRNPHVRRCPRCESCLALPSGRFSTPMAVLVEMGVQRRLRKRIAVWGSELELELGLKVKLELGPGLPLHPDLELGGMRVPTRCQTAIQSLGHAPRARL